MTVDAGDLSKQVAQIEALRDELKTILQAGHEMLQGGNEMVRALRAEISAAKLVVPLMIKDQVEEQLVENLEVMGSSIKEAMDKAVAKVGKEFDKLEALFLGTEGKATRAGMPPLAEVIVNHKQRKDSLIEDAVAQTLAKESE
jgi:hypothetical protein